MAIEHSCASCTYHERGACRVYFEEPIPSPQETTCNEYRITDNARPRVPDQELPSQGMGVYEAKRGRNNETELRLRAPRRRRGEGDVAFMVRLGGLLRFPVRLGGWDEIGRTLAPFGRAALREIDRTLDSKFGPARVVAADILGSIPGPRALLTLRQRVETETDPAVRAAIVLSLARLGDRSATAWAQKSDVASTLAGQGISAIVPPLLDLDAQTLRRLAPDERVRTLVLLRASNRAEAALLAWVSVIRGPMAPPEISAAAGEALDLAGKGTDTAPELARIALRHGAPPPQASDALAVALFLPALLARGPEARTVLIAEAIQIAATTPARGAALVATSAFLTALLEAEPPLSGEAAIAKAAEAAQPLHPGFAQALASPDRSRNLAGVLAAGACGESTENAVTASANSPLPARAAAAALQAARLGLASLPVEVLGHADAPRVALVIDRRPARR